jgi:hypothetical protein
VLDGAGRSLNAHAWWMVILAALGVLMVGSGVAAGASSPGFPDGRALEMVSPPDKNGGDIRGIHGDNGGGVVEASPDGNRITYVSLASFADAQGALIGSQYVSERTSGGWLVRNISAPTSAQTHSLGGAGTPYEAFSSTISRGLVLNGESNARHPVQTDPLTLDAPDGYQNYYLVDIPSLVGLDLGSFEALLTEAPSQTPTQFELELLGATPNLSHIVVRTGAALAPGTIEASGRSNIYEWVGGRFYPVNIQPDGLPDPSQEPVLGSGVGQSRIISDDGSRLIWTGASPPPLGGTSLYLRDHIGTPQVESVQVDASQGGPDEGQGGTFLTASEDLSQIYFADRNRLTPDSTAFGGGSLGDMYKFDVNSGTLTDLTVDHIDAEGAGLQGVLGASNDGSFVYFVANGRLAPNAPPGSCRFHVAPPSATCNLYVWHNGEIHFIATLGNEDRDASGFNALGVAFDWDPFLGVRTSRVTPDGRHLLFMSRQRLTNYDNIVSTGNSCGKNANEEPLPAECEEIFLYDANTNHIACVSCNPTGARPTAPSGIPGGTEFKENRAIYQSPVLSADGARVFFDSADALSPQDTNGQEDVYEYEDGHVYLLSGGKSAARSTLVDASADGKDAFFITRGQLVGQDTDQLVDLYDARSPHISGEQVGFPAPPAPAPCAGEGCRPSGSAPPVFGAPTSVTFTGLGNVVPTTPVKTTVKHRTKKTKKIKAKTKKQKRKKRGKLAKLLRSLRRVARGDSRTRGNFASAGVRG